MRFTLRVLGTEVFHVDTDPDEAEDYSRDLSGGITASVPIPLVDPPPEPEYEERARVGFTRGAR